jgi:hypothetical protein
MPGSATTPVVWELAYDVPSRVALRVRNRVGTRED